MLTILHGDALSKLAEVESEFVQTCVTSPPYWGLRSYGTEPVVWDNHNGCEHEWGAESKTSTWWGEQPNLSAKQASNSASLDTAKDLSRGAFCKCGAWRGELGLESTPELYVQHLVEIFREVRRVLRKDGTLWLNLGDSYAGSGAGGGGNRKGNEHGQHDVFITTGRPDVPRGLKPKDLVGIPWMVAFALRADGWYLRSDIIWAKPNPMPESVTDRPTKSHEYIFLLTKSQRYFYDNDAIRERSAWPDGPNAPDAIRSPYGQGFTRKANRNGKNSLRGQGANRGTVNGPANREGRDMQEVSNGTTRNRRSVWTIATAPFPDAHFATFPPKLIEPCILAGAPVGGVVLDPFAGSGTTGRVAIKFGRKAILIELKAEYLEMIGKRTAGVQFDVLSTIKGGHGES